MNTKSWKRTLVRYESLNRYVIFILNYDSIEFYVGIMAAPAEFLQQTLLKLFEAKILTCSGDYTNLQPGTKIQLNIDFRR